MDGSRDQALATVATILVAVGVVQIQSTREEAKRSRTLAACDRYDTDPVLDGALHRLLEGRLSGELERNASYFKSDIATVLNYLDGISIGIEQGLYIDGLAYDHLKDIVKHTASLYLDDATTIRAARMDPGNYTRLKALRDRWVQDAPRFNDRKWPWNKRSS